jgi:hypothetical protein
VIETGSEKVVNTMGPATEDSGKVRMGTLSPTFPSARIKRSDVTDTGRVRLGLMSPTFPSVRTR